MSRAVLVTGASRGIGAAVARAFAERGDRVAVHATRAERAEPVATALPGAGHLAVGADLADAEAVSRMVDAAAGALGGIEILVNNAGVFDPAHPIDSTDYGAWQAAWRTILGVNLVGAANVTWCAVRHMAAGARIVNVGSRGAFRGEPDHPAYGAAKAGLTAFGQSLAQSLGPRGISVTTVAPGFVETDMAAPHLEGAAGNRRRAESPLGRIAQPEDVAAAVLFLASPEAAMSTGTVLDVNGASFLRL